ncbi:ABC transporter C-terminal domain-containing protein [Actinosynnema sp. NPDC047251]|uniref:Uncharacterized protein n=1 Tax=Saccharothrix espanaensis (strain ATCC 51144 / DSM 44229 / JCM 9112 / NBRC 15066 / NRRL 15764) TaxID=1179773 RepID=K0KCF2_SACES|nr:ABC transporter C-terminal domain-containing protein [Saccharothrix espanaensis]CCH34474.1 hypothetical protein BN6_72400 [Saccharothrix espanaensis DSM 44229]
MFGAKRREEELEDRVAGLERQVAALSAQVEAVRPLLSDVARVAALTTAAQSAVTALERRAQPLGLDRPRTDGSLNTVYRADVLGFVAVYVDAGLTANVQLLVGRENPPTECVGVLDTGGERNCYAATIVRPGEHWLAKSTRKEPDPAFKVHFTPLF